MVSVSVLHFGRVFKVVWHAREPHRETGCWNANPEQARAPRVTHQLQEIIVTSLSPQQGPVPLPPASRETYEDLACPFHPSIREVSISHIPTARVRRAHACSAFCESWPSDARTPKVPLVVVFPYSPQESSMLASCNGTLNAATCTSRCPVVRPAA